MIQKFVDRFMEKKGAFKAKYAVKRPEDYEEIVRDVISSISCDEYGSPDPKRIHVINDGDYQGMLLFIIGSDGYHPSTYWAVGVDYGSCSGCDTLEAIKGYKYDDDTSTPQQVEEYLALALHIVQGIKQITGFDEEGKV